MNVHLLCSSDGERRSVSATLTTHELVDVIATSDQQRSLFYGLINTSRKCKALRVPHLGSRDSVSLCLRALLQEWHNLEGSMRRQGLAFQVSNLGCNSIKLDLFQADSSKFLNINSHGRV